VPWYVENTVIWPVMLTVTGHIIEMEHGALFKSEKISA
jgi:hypothetical protein